MRTRGAVVLTLVVWIAELECVEARPMLDSSNVGATDGSGLAPYLSSPSFLLFAIISLLLGAVLLVGGKRGWRVTTALGAGLLLELLVWITIANTLKKGVFGATTQSALLVWGIVALSGVLGLVAGGYFWRLGMVAMCVIAGISLGLSISMMATDCLPAAARWTIIALLATFMLVICPFNSRHFGMALATSLAGSFLLFLGIDLLAMKTQGMSLGLRFMLDGNASHAPDLTRYDPPVVTRVLLAISWVVAALATIGQTFLWREPFIRTSLHLSTPKITEHEHGTPTPPGSEPAESLRARMNRRYQSRLAMGEKELREPYSSESSDLSVDAMKHLKDLSDMTSPDEPPTPPASVLSTEFATGLKSRPPTFFNEPISTPTALGSRNNLPETSYFVSAVPLASAEANPHPPASAPLLKNTSTSTSSSRESRKSWRKPAPPIPAILLDHATDSGATSSDPVDLQVARRDPHSHGILTEGEKFELGVAHGLASGREQSIALTASTPSDDTSAFIKPDFGVAPPLPLPPPRDEDHTSTSFPTGPRLSSGSSFVATEMATGDRRAAEFVPFTVSPSSEEALKHRSLPIEGYGSARAISDPSQLSEISLVEQTPSQIEGRDGVSAPDKHVLEEAGTEEQEHLRTHQ